MRYLEPDLPIHTFTYSDENQNINETAWANIVNKHINAIPHFIHSSSINLINELDNLVKTQGEPFGSTSIYAQYLIYKEAKKEGIVVSLDGQGGMKFLLDTMDILVIDYIL